MKDSNLLRLQLGLILSAVGLALLAFGLTGKDLTCDTLKVRKEILLVNDKGKMLGRLTVGDDDRAQLVFEVEGDDEELRHGTVVDGDGVMHVCEKGMVMTHEH